MVGVMGINQIMINLVMQINPNSKTFVYTNNFLLLNHNKQSYKINSYI